MTMSKCKICVFHLIILRDKLGKLCKLRIGQYGYLEVFTTILQPRKIQVPDSFSLEFFFASGFVYAGKDAHFLTHSSSW